MGEWPELGYLPTRSATYQGSPKGIGPQQFLMHADLVQGNIVTASQHVSQVPGPSLRHSGYAQRARVSGGGSSGTDHGGSVVGMGTGPDGPLGTG